MGLILILTITIFGVHDEFTPLTVIISIVILALFIYAVVKAFKEGEDE